MGAKTLFQPLKQILKDCGRQRKVNRSARDLETQRITCSELLDFIFAFYISDWLPGKQVMGKQKVKNTKQGKRSPRKRLLPVVKEPTNREKNSKKESSTPQTSLLPLLGWSQGHRMRSWQFYFYLAVMIHPHK